MHAFSNYRVHKVFNDSTQAEILLCCYVHPKIAATMHKTSNTATEVLSTTPASCTALILSQQGGGVESEH